MEMSSAILELLYEERRTEMYKGTKRHNFLFHSRTPHTVTQLMYIAADCCPQRYRVTVMFSCTRAQHIYSSNTVQTVQCATELYLQ
jgi:hypothetical protein